MRGDPRGFGPGVSQEQPSLNGQIPADVTPAKPTLNETDVLNAISGGKYQTDPSFTRVSKMYASTKDPVNVVLWISTAAVDNYAPINPSEGPDAGPGLILPQDTIIVRAAFTDPSHTDISKPDVLTLISKGPPGSVTSFGEWQFGVTDPTGKVLPRDALEMNGDMTPLFGDPGTDPDCHQGCHENQRGLLNDFLFGILPENQCNTPMHPACM